MLARNNNQTKKIKEIENSKLNGFHHFVIYEPVWKNNDIDTLSATNLYYVIEQNLDQLDTHIDVKQISAYSAYIELLPNLDQLPEWIQTKIGSLSWLDKHTDILTEFGQLLVRISKNGTTYQPQIDDILPVTSFYDWILHPTEADLANTLPVFVWDMFVVCRRPATCQLRAARFVGSERVHEPLVAIPRFFHVKIAPPSNGVQSESKCSNISSQETAGNKTPLSDPYEVLRESGVHEEDLQRGNDKVSHCLSAQKLHEHMCRHILPQLMDQLINNPIDFNGLKLLGWKSLDADESQTESTCIELSSPVEQCSDDNNNNEEDNSTPQRQSCLQKKYAFHVEIDIDVESICKTPIYYSSTNWENATNATTVVQPSCHNQPINQPNVYKIQLRFVPVYSLFDLMNTTNKSIGPIHTNTIINKEFKPPYRGHIFLKPIETRPFDNLQLFNPNATWRCTSQVYDYNLLRCLVDVDQGKRVKVVRLIRYLCLINDQIHATQLTALFSIANLVQLSLNYWTAETQTTCQIQFDKLSVLNVVHSKCYEPVVFEQCPKPWQRTNVIDLFYGFVRFLVNVIDLHISRSQSDDDNGLNQLNIASLEWHRYSTQVLSQTKWTLNNWVNCQRSFNQMVGILLDRLGAS